MRLSRETALYRPTDAKSYPLPTCSGHIEWPSTTPAGVINMMAIGANFLASLASAGIELIRQHRRQVSRPPCSLRTNRHELDEISFSNRTCHIDQTGQQILSTTSVVTIDK